MMKVALASFNNNWYNPGSTFKKVLWYFVNIIFFKSSIFPFYGFKVFLLKLFGARIGKSVLIKPNVNIKYPWLLSVGNYVWIGENVWIDNLAKITIGDNVCISQSALLLCGNHDFTKTTFDLLAKPIVLEDGVWVGAKAIVVGGVTCLSHSVICAGSCITYTTDAYTIYQGNPAIKVKDRKIN